MKKEEIFEKLSRQYYENFKKIDQFLIFAEILKEV